MNGVTFDVGGRCDRKLHAEYRAKDRQKVSHILIQPVLGQGQTESVTLNTGQRTDRRCHTHSVSVGSRTDRRYHTNYRAQDRHKVSH